MTVNETEILPMPIRAVAPWFGSKRQLAKRIVPYVEPHANFWDLCTGGCAIIPEKSRSTMETVVDLHGGVVNLLRVVQDDHLAPMLYDRAIRTAACDALYESAADRCQCRWWKSRRVEDPDLEWAADYLITVWLGRNGLAGTEEEGHAGFCARYGLGGGTTATRFRKVAESIPAWWQRLRGVTVLQADVRDVLPKIPDESTTAIYIDPPYVKKSVRYIHDFAEEMPTGPLFGEDASTNLTHEELAGLLARFRHARVVVSYYDHPRVRALYNSDQWTYVHVDAVKNLANGKKGPNTGSVVAPEILLVRN